MPTRITLDQISKRYSAHIALHPLSLDIPPGEMIAVVGPSGCGKSTLLRLLAGFLAPDTGHILFDGQPVEHLPPERRPTSLVFQNYALWPHKTVAEHIAFGLRVRGWKAQAIASRVSEMLALVSLSGLEQRYPGQLSGGQQQRVALARSLAIAPEILLLDEPLSNLDAQIRVQMRSELRALQQRVELTTMYVTHDQEEALSVADRVIVLHNGGLEQYAVPEVVYQRPASPFVARFIGQSNMLPGCIHAVADQALQVQLYAEDADQVARRSALLTVPRTNWMPGGVPLVGQPVLLAIKPEQIQMHGGTSATSFLALQGQLVHRSFLGAQQQLLIRSEYGTLMVRTATTDGNGSLSRDTTTTTLWLPLEQVLVFADQSMCCMPDQQRKSDGEKVIDDTVTRVS